MMGGKELYVAALINIVVMSINEYQYTVFDDSVHWRTPRNSSFEFATIYPAYGKVLTQQFASEFGLQLVLPHEVVDSMLPPKQ